MSILAASDLLNEGFNQLKYLTHKMSDSVV